MTIVTEVDALRSRGFQYAALFLEDPVLVDGFTLKDIVALHEYAWGHEKPGKRFQFMGRTIEKDKVTSITVQAANRVRELISEDKPLSLEDAYFILTIKDKEKEKITRVENSKFRPVFNEKFGQGGHSCGFFHAVYFYTPFPNSRSASDFYSLPTLLINNIAAQPFEKAITGRCLRTKRLFVAGRRLPQRHHHLRRGNLHGTAQLAAATGETGISHGRRLFPVRGNAGPGGPDAAEVLIAEMTGGNGKNGTLVKTPAAAQAIERLAQYRLLGQFGTVGVEEDDVDFLRAVSAVSGHFLDSLLG